MLKHNIYTKKLFIHKDFPKELLVDIFRPFLFYDYMSVYYIEGTTKIYNSKLLLHNKLKEFYNYNKLFGRKIIKLTKRNNKIIKSEITFSTKHITFYNINVNLQQNVQEIVFNRNNVIAVFQQLYNYNLQANEYEHFNNVEDGTIIYEYNQNQNQNQNISNIIGINEITDNNDTENDDIDDDDL